MIWLNPRAMFEKVFSPRFVWAKVNPARDHVSFSELSDEYSPLWRAGIRITGVNKAEALGLGILGAAIDWDSFSESERKALLSRNLTMTVYCVRSLFRK